MGGKGGSGNVWWVNLRERDNSEVLGMDGRVVFNGYLTNRMGRLGLVWTGSGQGRVAESYSANLGVVSCGPVSTRFSHEIAIKKLLSRASFDLHAYIIGGKGTNCTAAMCCRAIQCAQQEFQFVPITHTFIIWNKCGKCPICVGCSCLILTAALSRPPPHKNLIQFIDAISRGYRVTGPCRFYLFLWSQSPCCWWARCFQRCCHDRPSLEPVASPLAIQFHAPL